MSLRGAIDFLNELRSGRPRQQALRNAAQQIVNTLWNEVYVEDPFTSYDVPDRTTMRYFIQSGTTPGAVDPMYNEDYLKFKLRAGLPVHEYTGEMKRRTFVEFLGNRVLFFIPEEATSRISRRGSFINFGPIHEQRMSVLKATMVLAWRDLMGAVGQTYRTIAESYAR